jgi:hypothetical protein
MKTNTTTDCLFKDVSNQYISPCDNLTENQFGFKDMGSVVNGGGSRRKMRLTRRQASKIQRLRRKIHRKIHRGGDCSKPVPDCFGNTLKNLSDNSYVGSQDAWAHRYTVGANSSTNVIQKGGGYRLSIDAPRIGGLSEVQSVPEPWMPSTINRNPYDSNRVLLGGRNRKSKKLYGGNSSPAPFHTSFGTTKSVMTDNMNQREFACNQPTWSPKCV